MEYRGNSENLAIVTMLGTSGVVSAWLIDVAVAGFEEGLLPLVMLGAAIGVSAVGYFVAPWFGRRGVLGWLLASLGAVIATGLGGVFGGILVYVLDPILHPATSPFAEQAPDLIGFAVTSGALVLASLSVPAVGLSWGAMMIIIHVVSRRLKS